MVRIVQLQPPVLLVLPGSHGQAASKVPRPLVLWAASGWCLMDRWVVGWVGAGGGKLAGGSWTSVCVCWGGGGGAWVVAHEQVEAGWWLMDRCVCGGGGGLGVGSWTDGGGGGTAGW